jgi:hypothetical protein
LKPEKNNQALKEPDCNQTCFVICPIGEPDSETRKRSDQVMEYIIKPAAEINDLIVVRSDKITKPGMISNQIITHMLNDRVVVADLTDRNANVFYELGVRHSFRKPVVQLLQCDQTLPFDVYGARTIQYDLTLKGASSARAEVEEHIRNVLKPDFDGDSPVSLAAKLDEASKNTVEETRVIFQSIADRLETLNKQMVELGAQLVPSTDLREIIPPAIKEKIENILKRYGEEVDLLKSVRYAGITGVFKRRETALEEFAKALDEESKDIMIVGSSLKGLLQLDEYKTLSDKLKFKAGLPGMRVRFLLTHPIVADLRASQEKRGLSEIGEEVIRSLETLRCWNIPSDNVRLYLGTPTCFGIMTTRKMLINPYPYSSVSYDSPCLTVEYSPEGGSERIGYFYDEFKSRHFGAWDTDLSVKIGSFDETINKLREVLPAYSRMVEGMLTRGKTFT